MKLIINADDLGYTPVINQAIFDLHHHQRISSASLLVNMAYSKDAIEGLQTCPDLDVGVHLNLTKGRPLSPQEKIPTLLSPAGAFWPTKEFYLRVVTGKINRAEIETELRAQINFALGHGINPTHLDSHSHWHVLPHLYKLVNKLAKAYQIPAIRQTNLRRTLIPSVLWFAGVIRQTRPKSVLKMPDYLISLHMWMHSDGKPNNLFFSDGLYRLITQTDSVLELVIHPGKLHDPDFPLDTLLTHQRQWEVEFLLSSRFDAWLDQVGAELSSYEGL